MRVAIIGSGPAGLTTAKYMLENNLKPLIFERLSSIGGMWSTEYNRFWGDTLTTNLSKYTCCYSDHNWKEEIDLFPTKLNVYNYLLEYKLKYLKDEHFLFQSEVINIRQSNNNNNNNNNNNKWIIEWKDINNNGNILEDEFDYVVVATGFFGEPFLPNIISKDFNGRIIHSNEFKNPKEYQGKKVVVIGGSHNAVEITSNVAFYAQSVFQITSKPFWPFPRFLPTNPKSSNSSYLPIDLLFYQRPLENTFEDETFINTIEKNTKLYEYFKQFHNNSYDYIPKNPTLPPYVAISDYYTQMFQSGKIQLINGRVHQIDENGNIHYNQTTETTETIETNNDNNQKILSNIDEIIFCTGYKTLLPFFSSEIKSILQFQENEQFVPLITHKSMIHPDLPGLGFVGMYRGPYFGIMEKQANWLSKLFSSKLSYPSYEEQLSGMRIEELIRNQSPRPQFPHPSYIGMMDGLARDIGLTRGEVNNDTANIQQNCQVVTPFSYRVNNNSGENINLNDNFMKESMFQLIERCNLGYLRGRVAFLNMIGNWNFSRTIINHLDSRQSGVVDGRASFLPITDLSTTLLSNDSFNVLQDLLYHEEGTFTLNQSPPLQFSIQRDDHYSYNSLNDSIDINFIKNSIKAEHFLTLRFNNDDTNQENWWCAESDHWCSPDTYTAKYNFSFSSLNLIEIIIEIICKGPNKDYKTITRYTRPLQSTF